MRTLKGGLQWCERGRRGRRPRISYFFLAAFFFAGFLAAAFFFAMRTPPPFKVRLGLCPCVYQSLCTE